MKTALLGFALVLVSSSAFAAPEMSCELWIAKNSQTVIAQATSFIEDLQSLENQQIKQDGESQLAFGTRGMMARARMIVETATTLSEPKNTLEGIDLKLTAQLCEANLDVMTVISSSK